MAFDGETKKQKEGPSPRRVHAGLHKRQLLIFKLTKQPKIFAANLFTTFISAKETMKCLRGEIKKNSRSK